MLECGERNKWSECVHFGTKERVAGAVSQLPGYNVQALNPRPSMVQTSKTDHFFKLAPFRSPLTDFIDFGMAGKLLTSAT